MLLYDLGLKIQERLCYMVGLMHGFSMKFLALISSKKRIKESIESKPISATKTVDLDFIVSKCFL